MIMDYTILVGGEAGQGMDTFANLLEIILKRSGFHVFSKSDYMSRVRGGHNFIQIRFSDKPIYTYREKVDILFALNDETAQLHKTNLIEEGIMIADEGIGKVNNIIHLPLIETAKSLRNSRVYTTIGLELF